MDWTPIWEIGKLIVPIISALVSVGVAIWRAGVKDRPDFVLGNYHRERMADKDGQIAKLEAKLAVSEGERQRLEDRVDRLIGTADRSVRVAATAKRQTQAAQ